MALQGADRELRVPQDLMRFKELPMQVRYMAGGSGEGATRRAVPPPCSMKRLAACGSVS